MNSTVAPVSSLVPPCGSAGGIAEASGEVNCYTKGAKGLFRYSAGSKHPVVLLQEILVGVALYTGYSGTAARFIIEPTGSNVRDADSTGVRFQRRRLRRRLLF